MLQKERGKQERAHNTLAECWKCLVWAVGRGVEDRVHATLTVTSLFHPKLSAICLGRGIRGERSG